MTDFIAQIEAGTPPTELRGFIQDGLGAADVGITRQRIPNSIGVWLKRWILPSSPADFELTDVRLFDVGELFRLHRIVFVHVRGHRLEGQVLPSGGSFGLFGVATDHFHYLSRRKSNVELLLREESKSLDDASPRHLAGLLAESLGRRGNSGHEVVHSAQDIREYKGPLDGFGGNYEANDQELSRVEGIVVDPAIAHREDHWLVSYCTLYGWMHQMNTLIAHECKIARDDFSIDMTESVLSRKVFKCMPMVRY